MYMFEDINYYFSKPELNTGLTCNFDPILSVLLVELKKTLNLLKL